MSKTHTVALDVDGTIAKYDTWKGIDDIGDPIPGAVEFTKKLSEIAKVLIYTTRTKVMPDRKDLSPEDLVKIIKTWLDKNGFYYDKIYSGQGKPITSAIIDDRSVECAPQKMQNPEAAYILALEKVKKLLVS